MSAILKAGSTLFWFIVAVAIFSRLVSDRNIPDLIKNGAQAITRLYNGSFGY